MNTLKLFYDSFNNWTTVKDMCEKMKQVGAQDCKVLFVHTDVMFGKINPELSRTQYLDAIYQTLLSLDVDTIMMPSFTFSFCNNEVYDVKKSKTYMGVLNEYVRKQPNVMRSVDPILSMIAVGKDMSILMDLGHHSLGKGSSYDKLHNTPDVKFLFLGAEIAECFTYIHYMEKILDVPYRFDMPFTGTIIDADGNSYEDTFNLYAGCKGVKPACSYYFKDYLIEKGYLAMSHLGDKQLTCISEVNAYREIQKKLEADVCYFLEQPFTEADLEHIYIKGLNGERITSC